MNKRTWLCKTAVLVLALILMFQNFPQGAVAVDGAATDPEKLVDVIEPQIRAYAASINQKDADSNAATVLAKHGLSGGGKALKMDASAPLTATLMNSELVQDGFASFFAAVFQYMDLLDLQSAPGISMKFGWHKDGSKYTAHILTDSGKYPDNLDWQIPDLVWEGKGNSYDSSLDWLVGGANADVTFRCLDSTNTERTYQVTAVFKDRFDFSMAKGSGFNKLLSGLGMLLFKEFDWSCTVSFPVTIPWSCADCSHSSGAYHWTHDGQSLTMISEGDNGFTRNDATLFTRTSINGKSIHYYKLENTVRLLHHKPWVVEYDALGVWEIYLSAIDDAITKSYPHIQQREYKYLFMATKEFTYGPDADQQLRYAYNFVGIILQDGFTFKQDATYTYRMENVPDNKGGSRIYLTVTETETGMVCMDRIPLDDYFYYGGWMDKFEEKSTESNLFGSKDILINYIGTKNNGLHVKYLDLRIWEEGQGNVGTSYFTDEKVEATCTAGGYTVRTCGMCGFVEQVEETAALGHDWVAADCVKPKTCARCGVQEGQPASHSFSDWEVVRQPACLEEGTQVRTCVCGAEERQAVAALSHNYAYGSCLLCDELDPGALMGDVDFDGRLSYNDALAVLRYSIQLDDLKNPALADINGDQTVNYGDALQILRMSIGLE